MSHTSKPLVTSLNEIKVNLTVVLNLFVFMMIPNILD